MCRQIVLGNGDIVVSLDETAQIRDFCFPFVGSENHINTNSRHRIGVWVEGKFTWLENPDWQFSFDYQKETLASDITATNKNLEIELRFLDLVYNEKNIFIRKVSAKNLSNKKRTVKLFFNQEFQIYEAAKGNTAYYDPYDETIIHYKGRRVFLVSGRCGKKSFDDYSIGLSKIEGKEGTWKDAEDGTLSKNSIEHGSVDSTIGFTATPDANSSCEFIYWITAGKTIQEVKKLHYYILKKSPAHLMETTQDFWHAWVNKPEVDFRGLNHEIINLFKKSLLFIKVHSDNRGGIIASSDAEMLQYGRDTYGYIWPRDAAFAALALDKTGYFEVTKRFFEFSNDVLSEGGYFLHKYLPDQALGSSWHPWIKNGQKQMPIQEDETALVLYTLFKHYELTKDLEFIEHVYNSLIKKSAQFLFDYRDATTKLPHPSYDLWEQSYGTSTFTAAAVAAALNAAGQFAKILGKEPDEEKYAAASREVKDAILKYLYNEKENYFYKLIEVKDEKILHDNTIDISSLYGVFNFGILDIDDEMIKKSVATAETRLLCKTATGGFARYEGDNYYRVSGDVPGNPWFVTTLWYAQYLIRSAKSEKDLKKAEEWLNWTAKHATSAGILSEQLHPHTGKPLSAGPLTWSHAEFVNTVMQYLDKLKEIKKS